jgi:hypothetical protein
MKTSLERADKLAGGGAAEGAQQGEPPGQPGSGLDFRSFRFYGSFGGSVFQCGFLCG